MRAEALLRLTQLADEFAEAAPSLSPAAPIAVAARFDEYALELSFAWTGKALTAGPALTLEPDADEDAQMNGVVFALMTRLADRMTTWELPDDRQELTCRIDQ